MLDYYRSTAPCPNRKAHEVQNFLRFMIEQLKEMSQNTKKQGFLIKDNVI